MSSSTAEPAPSHLEILCEEPFRIFFPLGLLAGLIGVSHWLWYYVGLSQTFSGFYHGILQIQGFEMAFATGFLTTALPRFLEVPGSRPWELLLGVALLLGGTLALYLGYFGAAEIAFILLVLHLLVFAGRRFARRRDNPPPAFVFVGFGLFSALAGGLLMLWPLEGFALLGQRLVEQGMLINFILAIGSYLGPRLLYQDAREPDASGPGARRQLAFCIVAGLALLLSFPLQVGFSQRWGLLLRALLLTVFLVRIAGLRGLPGRRLWHLYILWIAFWCVPAGLWVAGFFPDYELPALHLTFIGGFGSMTLIIATRVIAAHCGFEALWGKNTWTMAAVGSLFALALLSRAAADLHPDYYFGFLHIGAGFWLLGALIWGWVCVPKLAPWHVSDED